RLVLEGQVDDAIGRGGCPPQAVEVVQIAALHLGAGGGQCGGGAVGTGQADDLMPGREQFGDDGGTDVSGRAGDENTHEKPPMAQSSAWGVLEDCVDGTWCHQRSKGMTPGVITYAGAHGPMAAGRARQAPAGGPHPLWRARL